MRTMSLHTISAITGADICFARKLAGIKAGECDETMDAFLGEVIAAPVSIEQGDYVLAKSRSVLYLLYVRDEGIDVIFSAPDRGQSVRGIIMDMFIKDHKGHRYSVHDYSIEELQTALAIKTTRKP